MVGTYEGPGKRHRPPAEYKAQCVRPIYGWNISPKMKNTARQQSSPHVVHVQVNKVTILIVEIGQNGPSTPRGPLAETLVNEFICCVQRPLA